MKWWITSKGIKVNIISNNSYSFEFDSVACSAWVWDKKCDRKELIVHTIQMWEPH
jgi:hypothetical protein